MISKYIIPYKNIIIITFIIIKYYLLEEIHKIIIVITTTTIIIYITENKEKKKKGKKAHVNGVKTWLAKFLCQKAMVGSRCHSNNIRIRMS